MQLTALYALGLLAPTMNFPSVRDGARLALALALGLVGLGLAMLFIGAALTSRATHTP